MTDQQRLDELVDLVAARTGRNVTLDDVYGRVIASNTSRPTTDRARIDAVMLKVVPEDVRAWEVETGVAARQRPFVQALNQERGYLARLCLPMVFRGVRLGYLWILGTDETDDLVQLRAEIAGDQAALDRLAERVASALHGDDADRRRRDDALRNALLGTPRSDQGQVSLPASTLRVVVAIGLEVFANTESASVRLLAVHASADAARGLHLDVAALVEPDHVVVVAPAAIDPAGFTARFESTAQHRRPSPSQSDGIVGTYGVSQPFTSLTDLPAAYGQAVLALQASAVDPSITGHRFDDAGVYQYAAGLGRPIGQTLLDRLNSSNDGPELLELLERLYDSDAPMQKLADDLHMHRTSLYNRLQRISRVIDADPLSARIRLQLHIAMKLRRWTRRPRFALHDTWESADPSSRQSPSRIASSE